MPTMAQADDSMADPTPGLMTGLIHHPYQAPPFGAIPVGVYKASTIIFESVAALRARSWKTKAGYTYGLHGTPTTFVLEERIAALEGGSYCSLAPSGLAAIAMVNIGLLQRGDEVLLPDNVYGPSKEMARTLLADWGIGYRLYDPLHVDSLATAIGSKTKLVWLEAPGSVTMEFPDLRALVGVARARGITTALDNTWGAGLAFRPFDLGLDIVMQALTKYPSGGADVLMGSVVTRDQALHQRVLQAHVRLGIGVAGNDAEAILRGLPSMAVRYRAQDQAARHLAQWLTLQPRVMRVLHPALAGAPGHTHWAATCSAAAGLFSFLLDESLSSAQVDAFVDGLGLFRIGYSWGGPVSLAVPYDLLAMRGAASELRGHLVRLAIGLEDVADLQADLAAGLDTLG